jgi:5-formyltetrahydrofolate cyclo-ligase
MGGNYAGVLLLLMVIMIMQLLLYKPTSILLPMLKAELRRTYRQMRMQLTDRQVAVMSDLMLIQFQRLGLHIPSLVMTYAAIQKWKEFDPIPITDYCYFKNPDLQLLYPIVVPVNNVDVMLPATADDETVFELNPLGFAQPVNTTDVSPGDVDLVIVPLLAFDEQGYRVGYGKGFYDKFLQQCRADVVKIGFSYFDPVKTIADAGTHDVKLDFCITHNNVYSF